MKFSLILFLSIMASHTYAERVTLFNCNREFPELGRIIEDHYKLQQRLNIPRTTYYEQEQRLKAMGNCDTFLKTIKDEIVEMAARAPAEPTPQPRTEIPQDRPSRDQGPDTYEDEEPRREEQSRDNGVLDARDGVLIVTDERYPRAAMVVKDSFDRTAPFSCLDLNVEIYQVSSQELGCHAHRGNIDRVVLCDDAAKRKAQSWKNTAKAKHVIIVTESGLVGGNGAQPATVTNSLILGYGPLAGIHELMHTFGFSDGPSTNTEYAPVTGDIMNCTGWGCYVSADKWEGISRGFGKRIPNNCR